MLNDCFLPCDLYLKDSLKHAFSFAVLRAFYSSAEPYGVLGYQFLDTFSPGRPGLGLQDKSDALVQCAQRAPIPDIIKL